MSISNLLFSLQILSAAVATELSHGTVMCSLELLWMLVFRFKAMITWKAFYLHHDAVFIFCVFVQCLYFILNKIKQMTWPIWTTYLGVSLHNKIFFHVLTVRIKSSEVEPCIKRNVSCCVLGQWQDMLTSAPIALRYRVASTCGQGPSRPWSMKSSTPWYVDNTVSRIRLNTGSLSVASNISWGQVTSG